MTKFDLITKCEEMVQETFRITGSSKMPKKYRFTLLNRLQNTALEIYANIITANDLDTRIPREAADRLINDMDILYRKVFIKKEEENDLHYK